LVEEWKGIPAESRILTSEDVFDKTLTIRGKNREIDRQRDMVAQKWWAYNVEGKHTNMTSLHGPEYEAWKNQHSMKGKSMSRVIKEEVGFNIKTGSNGENAFEFFVEKVQGNALYLLDEPIAGVDPAARDYILRTIVNNYEPNSTIVLSTHLISDIERILDDVIFIRDGHIVRYGCVEDLRKATGTSIDHLFREEFRC
jgi:ABC-type uncharacterized transport system ATPase subunit